METLTVREYANKIGAYLKPTCLEDMPVIEEFENDQPDNFFLAAEKLKHGLMLKTHQAA